MKNNSKLNIKNLTLFYQLAIKQMNILLSDTSIKKLEDK